MELAVNKLKHLILNEQKIGLLLALVLLLLCAFSVQNISKNLTLAATPQTVSAPPEIVRPSIPEISQFHLYGDYAHNLKTLPETTLQLSLQGVLSSSTSQESRAIISSPGGQTKVYQIGQTVPGGAILKAIEHNRVILSYNNQLESLNLPVPKLINGVTP